MVLPFGANIPAHLYENRSILSVLQYAVIPLSIGEIAERLPENIHRKTLQRRLKSLVLSEDVLMEGERRNARYMINNKDAVTHKPVAVHEEKEYKVWDEKCAQKSHEAQEQNTQFGSDLIQNTSLNQGPVANEKSIFSPNALSLLSYLNVPSFARAKSSYQAQWLEGYEPNQTRYVPLNSRQTLAKLGARFDKKLAAGTYAKHIGQRLLIDLSYHSSRLEGNTYSQLETQNLIEQGALIGSQLGSTGERTQEETTMIMNHKEGIEFMIENAEEIAVDHFTIRNIHALLSQDLMNNPAASGGIRQIGVRISKSAYVPLDNPHQLKQNFMLLLQKAARIVDPFEQSFFLFVHLSYLQAFEDVNKRTARLACNIPFIQQNLCPLSFVDVPRNDYLQAMLYLYETLDLSPALELFEWAYARSCEQYDAVKASLGTVDTYRLQHRAAKKEAMGLIIRKQLVGDEIKSFLLAYSEENSIPQPDKFIVMTTQDLEYLHEGAIVGLHITVGMFKKWKALQKP